MDDNRFTQCPCCRTWFSRGDLLENPAVEPIGMTFDGGNPAWNLIYFNHLHPKCGSTFTVPAERLACCLTEPAPVQVLAGSDRCQGHCKSIEDLSLCENECHWAPYRRLLLRMLAQRGLVR